MKKVKEFKPYINQNHLDKKKKMYRWSIYTTLLVSSLLIAVPFTVYGIYLAYKPVPDIYYTQTEESLQQYDYNELADLIELDESNIGIDFSFSSTSYDTFTYSTTTLQNNGYTVVEVNGGSNIEIGGGSVNGTMTDTIIFIEVDSHSATAQIIDNVPTEEINWTNVILIPYVDSDNNDLTKGGEIAYKNLTIQPSIKDITITDSIILGTFIGYTGVTVLPSNWTFTNSTILISEVNTLADNIIIDRCSFYYYEVVGNEWSSIMLGTTEYDSNGNWYSSYPLEGQTNRFNITWSYSVSNDVWSN